MTTLFKQLQKKPKKNSKIKKLKPIYDMTPKERRELFLKKQQERV